MWEIMEVFGVIWGERRQRIALAKEIDMIKDYTGISGILGWVYNKVGKRYKLSELSPDIINELKEKKWIKYVEV